MINMIFKKLKNKKTLSVVFLFLLGILTPFYNISFAYDEQYSYNLDYLGNMENDSPFFLDNLTITDNNTKLSIFYEVYDCEYYNDMHFYINGTGFDIPCSWWSNWSYALEGNTTILNSWTYEFYFDFIRDDRYEINDVFIGVDYPIDWWTTPAPWVWWWDVTVKNSFIRELYIFPYVEDFQDFLMIQNAIVVLAMLVIVLLKTVGFNFRS